MTSTRIFLLSILSLACFFLQAKSVLPMPLSHNGVTTLVNSGVLELAGPTEHYAIEGPVGQLKIAPAAKSQLNRQLLRLPEGNLDEQQRNALLNSRPDFVTGPKRLRRQAA